MKVLFKSQWFAPSGKDPKMIDNGHVVQTVSGQRFRKGIQEIPDRFAPYLPRSAKVLDKAPEPVVVEESFRDHDSLRPVDKMAAVRAAKAK